jgi:hypothetical protein
MKLMFKLSMKVLGLIITLSVLFAAFTVITERANRKYEKSGSYSSELLTWEQEHAGGGTLKVFGNPVKLNFESLNNFKTTVETGAVKLTSYLPTTARTTIQNIFAAITSITEALFRFLF